MLRRLLPTFMMLALAACDGGDTAPIGEGGGSAAPILEPPAEGNGFQIGMELEVPGGTEVWKCKIDKLPEVQGGFFLINQAASKQSDSVHHMDVMALALTPIDRGPGVYDCDEIYADNPILMEEGIFLYASQVADQEIQLPEGTVAMVPTEMLYMQEIHYVNSTPDPVNVYSYVNAYTIDVDDVEARIWGTVVRDAHIEVPPSSEHVEWTRCVMNEDVDVVFLSSHTHQLGVGVTVNRFDGKETGERIYANDDWHAPKLLDFSPSLKLKKGEGLEFACTFQNPTTEMVHWGFAASDEMCQIGLVFTPDSSTAECTVVETSDGVIDTTGEGED